MQVGAVAAGHRVLLVDDVLATGRHRVRRPSRCCVRAGAEVVGVAVLLELPASAAASGSATCPVVALRAV